MGTQVRFSLIIPLNIQTVFFTLILWFSILDVKHMKVASVEYQEWKLTAATHFVA